MVECEICGSDDAIKRIVVDDVVLEACRKCSKFGTEMKTMLIRKEIRPFENNISETKEPRKDELTIGDIAEVKY